MKKSRKSWTPSLGKLRLAPPKPARWMNLSGNCERLTLCPCHSLLLAGTPWWKGWMCSRMGGWPFGLCAGGRLWCEKKPARCVFLFAERQRELAFLSFSILLDPLDGKIDKLSLPHEAKLCLDHHGVRNIVSFFKCRTDPSFH